MNIPMHVQMEMTKHADTHFGFPSAGKEKLIIVDRSGLSEYNTAAENSQHVKKIKEAINNGTIKIINHDLIEQTGTYHPWFYAVLHDMGVRVPATLLMLPHTGKRATMVGQPIQDNSSL